MRQFTSMQELATQLANYFHSTKPTAEDSIATEEDGELQAGEFARSMLSKQPGERPTENEHAQFVIATTNAMQLENPPEDIVTALEETYSKKFVPDEEEKDYENLFDTLSDGRQWTDALHSIDQLHTCTLEEVIGSIGRASLFFVGRSS